MNKKFISITSSVIACVMLVNLCDVFCDLNVAKNTRKSITPAQTNYQNTAQMCPETPCNTRLLQQSTTSPCESAKQSIQKIQDDLELMKNDNYKNLDVKIDITSGIFSEYTKDYTRATHIIAKGNKGFGNIHVRAPNNTTFDMNNMQQHINTFCSKKQKTINTIKVKPNNNNINKSGNHIIETLSDILLKYINDKDNNYCVQYESRSQPIYDIIVQIFQTADSLFKNPPLDEKQVNKQVILDSVFYNSQDDKAIKSKMQKIIKDLEATEKLIEVEVLKSKLNKLADMNKLLFEELKQVSGDALDYNADIVNRSDDTQEALGESGVGDIIRLISENYLKIKEAKAEIEKLCNDFKENQQNQKNQVKSDAKNKETTTEQDPIHNLIRETGKISNHEKTKIIEKQLEIARKIQEFIEQQERVQPQAPQTPVLVEPVKQTKPQKTEPVKQAPIREQDTQHTKEQMHARKQTIEAKTQHLKDLELYNTTLDTYLKQINDQNARIAELHTNLRTISNKQTTQTQAIGQIQEDIKSQLNNLNNINNNIIGLEKQINELQEKYKKKIKEIKDITHDSNKLKPTLDERIKAAQSQMQNMKTELKQAFQDISKKFENIAEKIQKDHKNKMDRTEEMRKKYDELIKKQSQELKNSQDILNLLLSSAQQHNKDIDKQLLDLKKTVTTNKQNNEQMMTAACSKMEQQLETLRDDTNEQIQKLKTKMEQNSKNMQNNLKNIQKQEQATNTDLEKMQKRCTEQLKALKEIFETYSQQNQEYSDIEKKIQDIEETLTQKLQNSMDDMRQKIEEKIRNVISTWKGKTDEISCQANVLIELAQNLKDENDELNNKNAALRDIIGKIKQQYPCISDMIAKKDILPADSFPNTSQDNPDGQQTTPPSTIAAHDNVQGKIHRTSSNIFSVAEDDNNKFTLENIYDIPIIQRVNSIYGIDDIDYGAVASSLSVTMNQGKQQTKNLIHSTPIMNNTSRLNSIISSGSNNKHIKIANKKDIKPRVINKMPISYQLKNTDPQLLEILKKYGIKTLEEALKLGHKIQNIIHDLENIQKIATNSDKQEIAKSIQFLRQYVDGQK